MALRRINPRKKPLLLLPVPVPRPFSSNPPFPPPPPSDPKASPHPPSPPAPDHGREAPTRNPSFSPFQDIRERLKSSPARPPPRWNPSSPPPRHPGYPQPSVSSFDDICRSLQSFRATTPASNAGVAPPPPSQGGATPNIADLLKNQAAAAPPQGTNAGAKSVPHFKSLFESIRKPKEQKQKQGPPLSPTPFLSSTTHSIFHREKAEAAGKEEGSGVMLSRDYSYEDLGKKLAELRPAGTGKDGKEEFSLEELHRRIAKLAELEKNEPDPQPNFQGLRKSLSGLTKIQNERDANHVKAAVTTMQGLSLLASIGNKPIPEYMTNRLPPQEELLERYFHPDHMSSEEKMKLELQKVRDEFKMSENDCGSARVQVAQLTVKIKHLSTVLHKKDKHSRKGLQDMVQRRKKYLKYLRRTDWDSYCLVLSKLGLRDIPEYKAPDYKSKSTTKAKSKKSKSKNKRKMKA